MVQLQKNLKWVSSTCISRLGMTQTGLCTISPYLDHSLPKPQAATQFSPEAAMSIQLVAGFSRHSLAQEVALSMVSLNPDIAYQSYGGYVTGTL